MIINIDAKLIELSGLMEEPLYLVGGAVRNAILGYKEGDMDIASAMTIDKVKSALKGTEFIIKSEYPRTGTLLIENGAFKAEYTTFRADSYPIDSGSHMPSSVEFTKDIYVDARRRDFTCNAVYYDILNNKFIDPLHGIDDIKNGILRTVDDPKKVLSEDALRILRLVRFRAELGFEIERSVLAAALESGRLIKSISRERITDEFIKILKAEEKYGVAKITIDDSLKTLIAIGCYYHTALIDYYSEAIPYLSGNMDIATILCGIYFKTDDVSSLLTSLKLPNQLINKVTAGIAAINACDMTLPEFIVKHYDGYMVSRRLIDPYRTLLIDSLASAGAPMRIGELKVNGDDVIALGYDGKEVGDILNRLLENSIAYILKTREEQLKELKKL